MSHCAGVCAAATPPTRTSAVARSHATDGCKRIVGNLIVTDIQLGSIRGGKHVNLARRATGTVSLNPFFARCATIIIGIVVLLPAVHALVKLDKSSSVDGWFEVRRDSTPWPRFPSSTGTSMSLIYSGSLLFKLSVRGLAPRVFADRPRRLECGAAEVSPQDSPSVTARWIVRLGVVARGCAPWPHPRPGLRQD